MLFTLVMSQAESPDHRADLASKSEPKAETAFRRGKSIRGAGTGLRFDPRFEWPRAVPLAVAATSRLERAVRIGGWLMVLRTGGEEPSERARFRAKRARHAPCS